MNGFYAPDILQCVTYSAKSNIKNSRNVKDYEIDIYIDGQRDMYIDGRYYKITSGSTVFRKPGQFVESYGDYNCYTLTLDFSNSLHIPQSKYERNRQSPEQSVCDMKMLDIIPDVFIPEHRSDLVVLMEKIESCSYPNTIDEEAAKGYVTELLFLLFADAMHYNRTVSKKDKKEKDYIKVACGYVKDNYASEISVTQIAKYLCLNENYFIRLFKSKMGITPNKYIMEIRLFYAKNMLMETDLSVSEVALRCGFNTPSYFAAAFKKMYNKTPARYRSFSFCQQNY